MDYLILLFIIIIPILADLSIKSTYNKYSKIKNQNNLTGAEVARRILDYNGLNDVKIISINGILSDNYDPRTKVVSLSKSIYSETSISALSVAAHEVGHAIQDKENYSFMKFRSLLVPVVNITSRVASLFIIIGLIAEVVNLFYVGIFCLIAGLFFQLITLPVEFNASARARKELLNLNIVNDREIKGTKKVLRAAAYTYVAGFIAMTLQIFRLILMSRRK